MTEVLSQLLKNQIEYNNTLNETADASLYRFMPQFNNYSSQMVMNIMHSAAFPQLVKFACEGSGEIFTFKTRLPFDLDETAIQIKSRDLALELDQHILKDLYVNAATIACYDAEYGQLYQIINEIIDLMKQKSRTYPNWIVAPSDVCENIKEMAESTTHEDTDVTFGIRHLCQMTWHEDIKIDLYENTIQSYNGILFGRKDNSMPTYQIGIKYLLSPMALNDSRIKLNASISTLLPGDSTKYYGRIIIIEE